MQKQRVFSLMTKILMIQLSLVVLIISGIGILMFTTNERALTEELGNKGQLAVSRMAQNVVDAVWNFDQDGVRTILDSEVADPEILGAAILQEDEIFAALIAGEDGILPLDNLARAEGRDDLYQVLRAPVEREGETLGTAVLFLSDSVLVSKLSSELGLLALELVAVLCLIGGSTVLVFFLMVLRPLKTVSGRLEEIAEGEGDLTRSLENKHNDEVGRLAQSFNQFTKTLREMISGIKTAFVTISREKAEISAGSEETSAAINQIERSLGETREKFELFSKQMKSTLDSFQKIQSSVNLLSGKVEEQSAAVEETTAAVEQMNASINTVSSTSVKKRRNVEALKSVVGEARNVMNQMARDMVDLDEKTEKIKDAVKVINTVASQTTLLSMNAAIEAAHAGQLGQGFAVVADEIRNLAVHSSESSKEIAQSLSQVVKVIQILSGSSAGLTESFQQIESVSGDTVQSFDEISSTMQELSMGTQEIGRAIVSLKDVSTTVSDNSQIIDSEVKELSGEFGKNDEMLRSIDGAMGEIARGALEINSAMTGLDTNIQDLTNSLTHIETSVNRFRT